MSITLNTKVFSKTSTPGPTSVILTTYSRGATLPDTLLLDHRVAKNRVEAGSVDKIHRISLQRTYINADGVVKTVGIALQYTIPDDAVDADIDGVQADLTDYMASAITLRAANVAALRAGVIE